MSFRNVGRTAAMGLLTLMTLSCGQVYRPVVIPCSAGAGVSGCPSELPPTPAGFHTVFGLSANVPSYPGNAMQIDVSGDSIVGETPSSDKSAPNIGNNPTYAAILPNLSKVFVTSAGSILPGGVDTLSSFSPAFQSTTGNGLGAVTNITLPAGSQPVFVNTTQSTAVYIANYNSNSVSSVNTTLNVVSNSATVGSHPVALAETPNGNKLYVANQGDNTVSSLNTADLSANVVTIPSGTTLATPVWVVARGDSQKVYLLTQGDSVNQGQLVTIDTATDTVTSTLSVGSGANFIFYDRHLNRLYVTNPSVASASNPLGSTVYIFSDTGGANDTPLLLKSISFNSGSAACPTGCLPTSVTALPDGSRFYVASYQSAAAPCPDATVTGACIIPALVVFDANSLALKTTLALLTNPPFAVSTAGQIQYAVPPVTSCASATLYSPTSTRFRVFTTSSADSSRVYVAMCDAGAIAVINTTNANANASGGSGTPSDTVVTDLPAAFSAGAIQSNGEPPNQNPIFLLTGQ